MLEDFELDAPDHISYLQWGLESVFPDSHHCVTLLSQDCINCLCPCDISRNFGRPVNAVAFGQSQAAGATMPEASVHKQRDSFSPKPEVGRPSNPARMKLPACDPMPYQCHAEPKFRRAISSRAYLAHH